MITLCCMLLSRDIFRRSSRNKVSGYSYVFAGHHHSNGDRFLQNLNALNSSFLNSFLVKYLIVGPVINRGD
jgi:hypothetical protein